MSYLENKIAPLVKMRVGEAVVECAEPVPRASHDTRRRAFAQSAACRVLLMHVTNFTQRRKERQGFTLFPFPLAFFA
jgi:hypothetical protein